MLAAWFDRSKGGSACGGAACFRGRQENLCERLRLDVTRPRMLHGGEQGAAVNLRTAQTLKIIHVAGGS